MDPIAHTLVGATLAETGLKRLTRYATPALIVGANLPDIDGIANFWGRDASLYFRRGWSHGVLALVVLPLALAAIFWGWHRWRHRQRGGQRLAEEAPLRMGPLIALCFIAVWSHPLLDWLNTYGVRLLMPFDGRWFYGDTLFIVDPWFWLLTAVGVVLARSQSYKSIVGWSLLAGLATILILWTDQLAVLVKLIWLAAIASIAYLRWRKPTPRFSRTAARAGLATLVLYIGTLYGLARLAEARAADAAIAQGRGAPAEAQANPQPGNPFSHRVILAYDEHYTVHTSEGERVDVPRGPVNPVLKQALQDTSIKGFVTWMRYPYWEISETEHSWIVDLRDLRYVGPGQQHVGIGTARVEVPKTSVPAQD